MTSKPRKRKINRSGYQDTRYKQLKAKIFKRDRGRCQMPNCKRKGQDLHHIMRWATHPELRYSENHVILLCRICHKKIFGKEEDYAPLFLKLISPPADVDILKIKYGIE